MHSGTSSFRLSRERKSKSFIEFNISVGFLSMVKHTYTFKSGAVSRRLNDVTSIEDICVSRSLSATALASSVPESVPSLDSGTHETGGSSTESRSSESVSFEAFSSSSSAMASQLVLVLCRFDFLNNLLVAAQTARNALIEFILQMHFPQIFVDLSLRLTWKWHENLP